MKKEGVVTVRLRGREHPKFDAGEEMGEACWRRLPAARKIKVKHAYGQDLFEKYLRGWLRQGSSCG